MCRPRVEADDRVVGPFWIFVSEISDKTSGLVEVVVKPATSRNIGSIEGQKYVF